MGDLLGSLIWGAKSGQYCVIGGGSLQQVKSSVCLAEKEKSSRPDVVYTRPDGMLSNKRSTEPSASER
jgi:hypothetical protein